MKITAAYLYPDFYAKKKCNTFNTKKDIKDGEKSFEEYLQYHRRKVSQTTNENMERKISK